MRQILTRNYQNIFCYITKYLTNLVQAFALIILVTFLSMPVWAQAETPQNPFANFETIMLPNGLKVWYKYLPNDTNVSVSVTIPYGSDQDPIGKEQLAHFTEHMLFSDHLGRTEEQIKKEVEDLGGVRNAVTYRDHTFYFVRMDKKYGLFAMDWLYKIISPHSMDERVVERQREPVALEVGSRKRELFDWIDAYYLNPSFLSQPDFWAREFGQEAFPKRDYYPYHSLYQITAQDLKNFYDTYYTPAGMTLTIIGNFDRSAVIEKINNTFTNLPSRPRHNSIVNLEDPQRFWQSYNWAFDPSIFYYHGFKFYNLDQKEHLKLIFISQLLRERLNTKLRFGDHKATYGIGVGVTQRGPATLMQIFGNLKQSEYNFAYEIIEKELAALRDGTLTNEEFETEKATVTGKLRVNNSSARDLEEWVTDFFYNPERHQDFPDLVTIFNQFTKADIQEFTRLNLIKKKEIYQIQYIQPLSQGTLSATIVAIFLLTVGISRKYLLSSLPMSKIRYIARFRMPLFTRLLIGLSIFILIAIGGRILYFCYELLAYKITIHIDSYWIQWLTYALMLIFALFLFMLILASLPRKLLLFNDSLAIKYFSYRSRRILITDIKEISLQKFSDIWLSRRIWRCVPLTFALFSFGIYLRLNNGWSYFFQIRNNEEFLKVLDEIKLANSQGLASDRNITK